MCAAGSWATNHGVADSNPAGRANYIVLCKQTGGRIRTNLRNSSELLANGITVRGVPFFMPLSPSITLCMYDPSVYVYRGNTGKSPICICRKDVEILNSFQALGANRKRKANAP